MRGFRTIFRRHDDHPSSATQPLSQLAAYKNESLRLSVDSLSTASTSTTITYSTHSAVSRQSYESVATSISSGSIEEPLEKAAPPTTVLFSPEITSKPISFAFRISRSRSQKSIPTVVLPTITLTSPPDGDFALVCPIPLFPTTSHLFVSKQRVRSTRGTGKRMQHNAGPWLRSEDDSIYVNPDGGYIDGVRSAITGKVQGWSQEIQPPMLETEADHTKAAVRSREVVARSNRSTFETFHELERDMWRSANDERLFTLLSMRF